MTHKWVRWYSTLQEVRIQKGEEDNQESQWSIIADIMYYAQCTTGDKAVMVNSPQWDQDQFHRGDSACDGGSKFVRLNRTNWPNIVVDNDEVDLKVGMMG